MDIRLLKDIISLETDEVFNFAEDFLGAPTDYDHLWQYWAGDIPICLVAHIDTVHKGPPKRLYLDRSEGVMWSPDGLGADDRAGVFAVLDLIQNGFRPHVILTDDEEIGCLGAKDLAATTHCPEGLKFLVQVDRRHGNDCVYYDCDNPKFKEYVKTFGFEEATGTFSDISAIAPAWKIAAVNLSAGYYREHSQEEHLRINELARTIDRVAMMLSNPPADPFEYMEAPRVYYKSYFELRNDQKTTAEAGTGIDATSGRLYDTGWDADYNQAFPPDEEERQKAWEEEWGKYLDRDELTDDDLNELRR